MLYCIKDLYNCVIAKRRVSHGLKDFVVQSDNGEFKSNVVKEYLLSVGGDRLTCCAYAPETQSVIERLWGTITNMSSAMMISKKLPECYWEFASAYAAEIYNNIPPKHPIAGLGLHMRSFMNKRVTPVFSKSLVVDALHILPRSTAGRTTNQEPYSVSSWE